MVVAMAAGLASVGAAMPVKAAEAKAALDKPPAAAAVVPLLAQPDSSALAESAPRGSMGAAAKNLRAVRRVGCCGADMVVTSLYR